MDAQTTILVIHLLSVVCGVGVGLAIGFTPKEASRSKGRTRLRAFAPYLLILLVPLIMPYFGVAGSKWWVLAGILVGYAVQLFRRLRLKLAAHRT